MCRDRVITNSLKLKLSLFVCLLILDMVSFFLVSQVCKIIMRKGLNILKDNIKKDRVPRFFCTRGNRWQRGDLQFPKELLIGLISYYSTPAP